MHAFIMNLSDFALLLLISASTLLDPCCCLDYSDIETLGLVNCLSKLSCANQNSRSTFRDRNCECDAACAAYDDCCIDAKPFSRRRQRPRPASSSRACFPYGGHTHLGVYVVSSCARGWDGPEELRLKCQEYHDLSDPLNAAPLTSLTQGRTYRNRYCAECNGASSAELLTWKIQLDCESLPLNVSNANVWNNLQWNEESRQWGVYRWSSSGEKMFYSCNLSFDLPSTATNSVRFCRANVISSCTSDWDRLLVRRACESYNGIVYSGVHVYRNPHCALCNGRVVDDISCEESLTARKKPLSFALLLDVNQSDGDQVGVSRQVTPRCPSDQKYDPFFKKCRTLTCALPGYKLENGRCIPG